ncbi:hypothetical protein LCGC14_1366310 [marine sediment metagenome]|uniref:Uncharacterized protein n=1 Tax=marine sediment metagenome TaxID=412755 RepID=A0A0F9N8S5_9ZZZZ
MKHSFSISDLSPEAQKFIYEYIERKNKEDKEKIVYVFLDKDWKSLDLDE